MMKLLSRRILLPGPTAYRDHEVHPPVLGGRSPASFRPTFGVYFYASPLLFAAALGILVLVEVMPLVRAAVTHTIMTAEDRKHARSLSTPPPSSDSSTVYPMELYRLPAHESIHRRFPLEITAPPLMSGRATPSVYQP